MTSIRSRLRRLAPPAVVTLVLEAEDVIRWVRGPQYRATASLRDFFTLQRMARTRRTTKRSGSEHVTIRNLEDTVVDVRYGTSDAQVVLDITLDLQAHLPDGGLRPEVIWDLGANLGLASAQYATLFPTARIHAVEAQRDLADAATAVTRKWADRITVLHGAVWPTDGTVRFAVEPGDEWGGSVVADPAAGVDVPAYSLNTLLADETRVDFMKMDVEGAEEELLRKHTEWASKVQVLNVEVHPPYTVPEAMDDLATLGFTTRISELSDICIIAERV